MVLQFVVAPIVAAQDLNDPSLSARTRQRIATLIGQLHAATEHELREGQTTVDEHGQRLFVGETAAKMKALHDETAKQVDQLIARPTRQRQAALDIAASFAADPSIAKALSQGLERNSVEYKHTTKSPYNESVPVEIYQSAAAQFEISALNDEILQFGPRPLTDEKERPVAFDLTPRFRQAELFGQVRRFLARHGGNLNLNGLTARVSDKDGLVYFFRWEDESREVAGAHPFVQVGMTAGGEVVSYTNTLGLPDSPASFSIARRQAGAVRFLPATYGTSIPKAAATIAGVYNFANNGNYYTEYGPSAYWWTTSNEGYCGHIGSCSPAYMKYTYESQNLSNYATWSHFGYESGFGTHYVFIPRINATTRQSFYQVMYSGGSSYSFSIDQLAYSDVFVRTGSTQFYAIGGTYLYDTPWGWGTPAGKKVGFDEIRIIY
jgi:hypothetical protein